MCHTSADKVKLQHRLITPDKKLISFATIALKPPFVKNLICLVYKWHTTNNVLLLSEIILDFQVVPWSNTQRQVLCNIYLFPCDIHIPGPSVRF